jgi:hypothetical protein
MDALFKALEQLIRPVLAARGNGVRVKSKHQPGTIESTPATLTYYSGRAARRYVPGQ